MSYYQQNTWNSAWHNNPNTYSNQYMMTTQTDLYSKGGLKIMDNLMKSSTTEGDKEYYLMKCLDILLKL